MTQPDAEAFCARKGGHLVTLDTQAKTDLFAAKVLKASPAANEFWIGLWSGGSRTTDRSQYRWYSGADPTSYQNWAQELGGQPDNSGGGQGVCVTAVPQRPNSWQGWKVAASWDDNSCDALTSFVCEAPLTAAPL
jgi:hypothetical protein